jgi:hypothetical protein
MSTPQTQNKGPDLKALGLKSATEVFDLLALLNVDGEPVIKNERILLDPKDKARAVFEYFNVNFGIEADNLPYLASLVKRDLKAGKIGWRKH